MAGKFWTLPQIQPRVRARSCFPKAEIYHDRFSMDLSLIFFNAAAFVAGLVVLQLGADKFIDSTCVIAERLGVPQNLIALLTAGAEWEEITGSLQTLDS